MFFLVTLTIFKQERQQPGVLDMSVPVDVRHPRILGDEGTDKNVLTFLLRIRQPSKASPLFFVFLSCIGGPFFMLALDLCTLALREGNLRYFRPPRC